MAPQFDNDDDRAQFEENRASLIEAAYVDYGVSLEAYENDAIRVAGSLSDIMDLFRDWRSEIEEML